MDETSWAMLGRVTFVQNHQITPAQAAPVNPSPTFDRVYNEIRRRVLAGSWMPGQRIELSHLANELDASVTPVRDALHRLIGEGLLATGPKDGFAIPGLTEPDLRDMYEWLHQLLMMATRRRAQGPAYAGEETMPQPQETSFPAVFAAIAARCDNVELRTAILSVEARLAPAHRADRDLLANEDELAEVRRALASGDPAMLRARLKTWHRRRIQAAGRIVHALYRPFRRSQADSSA